MHRDNMQQFLTVDKPSNILQYLFNTRKLDSEVARLFSVPQDENHHPEGNAFVHTLMVVDIAAEISAREYLTARENAILRLAALCHDMGKYTHTQVSVEGKITAHGHPEAGIPIAIDFLNNSRVPEAIIEHVLPLVNLHMAWVGFYMPDITSRSVRKLLKKLEPSNLQMLTYMVEADMSGRGGIYYRQGIPARMHQIRQVASVLYVKEYPDHLVSGDDIMRVMNIEPSPVLGKIKDALYKAQLDGKFTTKEEGIQFMTKNVILKGN